MTRNAPLIIRRARRSAVITSLGLALAVAFVHPPTLDAATITVGPACSLVNAIKSANANSDVGSCTGAGAYGADIIVLPFGTYALTAIDNGTDADAIGLPAITSDITIQGNGSTISRSLGASSPFFRIFEVRDGGSLTLKDLRAKAT